MARERPKNPQSDPDAKPGAHGVTTGYEAELWRMADALRGSMDAAEYKHVVLGLIFLKYISDTFKERHTLLESEREQGADPEDPDEYRAENIFWVPSEARWTHLKAQAKQPTIGSSSTRRWPESSATTRRSRTCCPRTMPAPHSTNSGSARLSTSSANPGR